MRETTRASWVLETILGWIEVRNSRAQSDFYAALRHWALAWRFEPAPESLTTRDERVGRSCPGMT